MSSTSRISATSVGCSEAAAADERDFADKCRERANIWTDNFDTYCFKEGTSYGDHYVTADAPEYGDPAPDERPDAAAFMSYWPWNAVDAAGDSLLSTLDCTEDPAWTADETPCLGRYPNDDYTPSGTVEDGGWPLCENIQTLSAGSPDRDPEALDDYLCEHAPEWTTSADLLPERVDGDGGVSWNSNLQWSQAMYVLLAESQARGEPYSLAPAEGEFLAE